MTVSNAVAGQEYLILSKMNATRKVVGKKGLEYEDDYHYLLVSPTWPDLDFCANDVQRVLFIDGKNRMIDVNNNCILLRC